MLSLAKLVSIGATGLSSSGLGLYFIPKYADENSKDSQLIYQAGKSFSGAEEAENFIQQEKSELEEMNSQLGDFKKASEYLVSLIKKEHDSMLKSFGEIVKSEGELKSHYEVNQQNLENWGKLLKQISDTNGKKLSLEAALNRTQYLNRSFDALGKTITRWGSSIETILCAIHNSKGEKSCDEESSKNWYKNNSYDDSSNLDSSGGGVRSFN